MLKGKFRYLISIASAVITATAVFCIWSYQRERDVPQTRSVNQEIVSSEQPVQTTGPAVQTEVTTQVNSVEVENPIDFSSFWTVNADVYAYIYIAGTNVDYPVLQHPSNNSYYLDYNIDKSKGYPGCIYTEKENAKDFTDPNTIIYGHNMRNGTMFKSLHKFENKGFFEQHRYIYIYLPDQVLQYKIFAAYTYSDRHILKSFDFSDESVYQSYINQIFNNTKGIIDRTMTVTTQDRMITLSTCTGNDTTRWLVQAVLQNRFSCAFKNKTAVPLPDGMITVMEGAKHSD